MPEDIGHNINTRLTALGHVKDWSTGLTVVQTAAIGVIGALLGKDPVTAWLWAILAFLFGSLLTSIYIGAVAVMGTVPHIVQNLPHDPKQDIYEQRGGIPGKGLAGLTLGKLCLLQANFFVLSLVLFGIFVVVRHLGQCKVN